MELIVWINVDKVILLVSVYCLLSLENVVLFFVRDMTIPSLNKLFLSIWSILLSYLDLSITINSLRIWIIFNQQLCNTIFTRVPYLLIPTWLQSPGIVFWSNSVLWWKKDNKQKNKSKHKQTWKRGHLQHLWKRKRSQKCTYLLFWTVSRKDGVF